MSQRNPFVGLEDGKYTIIAADPAWKYLVRSDKGLGRSADKHYQTQALDDIRELPVWRLAAKDCVLFIWVTEPFLELSFEIINAWGFKYKTVGFTWVKLNSGGKAGPPPEGEWCERSFHFGMGHYTRCNPEMCLLATRGQPGWPLRRDVRELIFSPLREHSRKPDEAYDRMRSMYDGPALEMNARTRRPGWDHWGNETEKFSNGVEHEEFAG
jgi:N6-adenosine-specific RNA methylase IME4